MADEPKQAHMIPVEIEAEMKKSYLDYAMSVIVARAIPDVRDGLKPGAAAHPGRDERPGPRIEPRLPQMREDLRRHFRKLSPARRSGHLPDARAPRAVVQYALPLIDGQGNYGSVDGDPPAAMRYTEARLAKITEEMLAISKKRRWISFRISTRHARSPLSSVEDPEFTHQRCKRHCRGYGDQHPSAQPGRDY